VAADSRNHSHIRFLGDLNSNLVHEIERFFISYNETKGKKFEVLGRSGPERAVAVIENAANSLRRSHPTATKRGKKAKV
jgi:inorganic pyrophosphatase